MQNLVHHQMSECVANRTPLLYTSRGVFREYDLFVSEMPRYLRCRFIDQRRADLCRDPHVFSFDPPHEFVMP